MHSNENSSIWITYAKHVMELNLHGSMGHGGTYAWVYGGILDNMREARGGALVVGVL